MAMVVKNNMSAISTLNTLNKNSSALAKSLEKVSSGMKINGAADDASGYAISERMRVQIRSLDQANQNTQNGNSMMKTAEGAVSSTVEILKTLKEKVINAANDTNTDSDRQTIQKELNQSIDQIDDNANVTFNGKYLVDGSKNTIGHATFTATTNQALSTDTKFDTELTALKARNGDDLELSSTDKVTVSYVSEGKTYSTTFQVAEKDAVTGKFEVHKLQDIFSKAEAISTDTIFANRKNSSVAKALGYDATDPAYISSVNSDIAAAETALSTSSADVGTKKTAMDTAEATYNTTLNSVSAETETIMAKADALWKALSDYDGAVAVARSSGLDLTTYKASASDSITLESAVQLLTALGDGTVSAATVALFNGSTQAAAQGLNTAAVTSMTNAASDYTIDSAQLVTDETDYNDKVAAYDASVVTYKADKNNLDKLTGPALLEGEKVGVAASDDMVSTASGQNAITITAANDGIQKQIAGLNISITDSQGNVKKSANAALDGFEETIRAQNASEDNAITLQVGAKANQSIKVGLTDMRSEALGLKGSDGTKLNISTQVKANAAVNVLDNAIQKALDQQTTIGSIESRLSYTSSNLTTASENVQASESAIRDADMAKEMTQYTKNNVLLQAAQSMLAQANQNSSAVLSLLQ